ncbi:hypothetical protein XELAEV_18031267mg [Xenopus laevis]|uniref:Ig-like domain-containing protein n=1 Tax=Xenopus laevis TaxID=8355 RepID=A0A974CMA7_XENLA|nr:hypothetical protein XELAEV_18031267mg [Xenopus laevis]
MVTNSRSGHQQPMRKTHPFPNTIWKCDVSPWVIINQPHLSITKAEVGAPIARIKCQVKRDSSDSSIVHWYIQKENEGLKRILYIADAKPEYDAGTDQSRFDSDKKSDIYTLIIQGIKAEDAATYFCANWDWNKHTD